jgi:peptidoglycan biosynthesis protein MviN/MurJ (putative lipid II flippase)
MEVLSRSLFALDRRWPPVIACMIPVVVNILITVKIGSFRPESLGVGASVGLMTGFLVLFAMAHTSRRRWLKQG